MKETRRGMLLVLSGPSGVGKGTMGAMLLKNDPDFRFSVSATTRAPRPGEQHGRDYFFLTEEEFQRLVEEDAFLESAEVHGHRYGTLKKEVYSQLENGVSVLLDIDVQGALKVMEREPECVTVFVLPPSYQALRERLAGRGTEDAETIERRMNNAVWEMSQFSRYQYLIVNDDLQTACDTLASVVKAEKHRVGRFFPELEDC